MSTQYIVNQAGEQISVILPIAEVISRKDHIEPDWVSPL
jgi:hypothetical protein